MLKHLIEPMDFAVDELESIFDHADDIISNPLEFSHSQEGKILTTLFYEPSTRTRLSFEAAMLRLGGKVIGFSEPNSSSVAKGESLIDTIRTVECYSDIAVIRHPIEGAPKLASMYSSIPVINAGDGGHQHPTQTLTDLLTIRRVKGRLSNMTIGLCGDLKFGRTVHSLIKAMSRYPFIKFYLISPKELKIPEYIKNEILIKNKIEFHEAEKIEDVIDRLDVLYMTRVQRERFETEEEYLRLKDSLILDGEKMKAAKKSMIVLHPLPRVNEISYDVDSDSRAYYFKQAKYGMYVRMALIDTLLKGNMSSNTIQIQKNSSNLFKCTNPKCITKIEGSVPKDFYPSANKNNQYRCSYCDSQAILMGV